MFLIALFLGLLFFVDSEHIFSFLEVDEDDGNSDKNEKEEMQLVKD